MGAQTSRAASSAGAALTAAAAAMRVEMIVVNFMMDKEMVRIEES